MDSADFLSGLATWPTTSERVNYCRYQIEHEGDALKSVIAFGLK